MPVKSENLKKSVCVIGAGAAGLCAARHCTADPNLVVTVFEQGDELGGNWIYEPDPFNEINHSSMYESLITNLPKEVMSFRDFPFKGFSSESFVQREEVLTYLKQYSKPIEHLIKYNCKVVSMEPLEVISGLDHCLASVMWKIGIEENKTGRKRQKFYLFDCVFVCNGHLSIPRFPSFSTKYKKPSMHSHYYRTPEQFFDKKVAIVGAGPSGCDIAAQLSSNAKEVYLLYRNEVPKTPKFGRMRNEKVKISAICDVDPNDSSLILWDNQRLTDIDCLIYCTGYKPAFPFLAHSKCCPKHFRNFQTSNIEQQDNSYNTEYDETDGNDVLIQLLNDECVISPLFADIVHTKFADSLFFIGIPSSTIPFVMFEQQVHFAIAFFNHEIPENVISKADIMNYEVNRLRELKKEQMPLQNYHFLGKHQWQYFEWLWNCTNVSRLNSDRPLTPRVPPVIRKIYEHCVKERKYDVEAYHNIRYTILDDVNFIATYSTGRTTGDCKTPLNETIRDYTLKLPVVGQ